MSEQEHVRAQVRGILAEAEAKIKQARAEGYRAGVEACIARLEQEALLARQGARMHGLQRAAEELRGLLAAEEPGR